MRYLIMLVVCIGLSSCFLSKPRRAERKIQKAMELDPERFQVDTLVIHDTVTIESFYVDTVKEFIYHDTVTVINNDRVHLKYFYDTTRLEIWHEVECKGDTIYIDKEVIVDKVVESPPGAGKWVVAILTTLCIILFTLLAMSIISRFRKG